MKVALEGTEVQNFPKRAGVGDDKVPTPTPTFTPTATATATVRTRPRRRRRSPDDHGDRAADDHDAAPHHHLADEDERHRQADSIADHPGAHGDRAGTDHHDDETGQRSVTRAADPADPLVRAASEVIGGPRGRYAVSRELPWVLTAALLSALTAVTAGFGILLRIPCLRTGFAGDGQFWNACYADLPTAYRDANLKAGLAAYLQGGPMAPTTGHPPITGLALTAVANLVPDGSLSSRAAWFFALWSVLLTPAARDRLAGRVERAPSRSRPRTSRCAGRRTHRVHLGRPARGRPGRRRHVGLVAPQPDARRSAARTRDRRTLLPGAHPRRDRAAVPALRPVARVQAHDAVCRLVLGAVLSAVWLLNPGAAASAYTDWASAGAGYGSPWLLPQLAGHALPRSP